MKSITTTTTTRQYCRRIIMAMQQQKQLQHCRIMMAIQGLSACLLRIDFLLVFGKPTFCPQQQRALKHHLVEQHLKKENDTHTFEMLCVCVFLKKKVMLFVFFKVTCPLLLPKLSSASPPWP
mmetsp:Transcript_18110/g.27619  ORF Transcript_18110/g.27619 Transcript_18110/m.27619 type:complete len:122 (-) Transcript_18110:414-779(-)